MRETLLEMKGISKSDLGARADIYRLIQDITARGGAVLMISSDLPELLGMSHRIAVMRRGRMVAMLPFIATLGALGIYRGLSLILTNGIPVVNLPRSFGVLATGDVAGVIPVPLVVMLIVALLIHSILKYTRLGRHAYAIGSNPEAARCCGIRIGRCTVMVYAICGALTGLAGMIESARVVTG